MTAPAPGPSDDDSDTDEEFPSEDDVCSVPLVGVKRGRSKPAVVRTGKSTNGKPLPAGEVVELALHHTDTLRAEPHGRWRGGGGAQGGGAEAEATAAAADPAAAAPAAVVAPAAAAAPGVVAAPMAVAAAGVAFSYNPPLQAFLRGTVTVTEPAGEGGASTGTVIFGLTWASTRDSAVTSRARYEGSLPPGAALPASAAAEVCEEEMREACVPACPWTTP